MDDVIGEVTEDTMTSFVKQRGLSVIVENKEQYDKMKTFLGDVAYLDWVPQMATTETGIVIWYDDETLFSVGSHGSTKYQENFGFKVVKFTDFFK